MTVYTESRCAAALNLNLCNRWQFYLRLQSTGGHWGVVFRDMTCKLMGGWILAFGGT